MRFISQPFVQLLLGFNISLVAISTPHASAKESSAIICEGSYDGHLQGIASDGHSLYWSHTTQLVKTDLNGKLSHRIDVKSHHGDLTYHDGRIYVAVEFGEFNQPSGNSDPWVFVYSADDLSFIAKHPLPELVHGCGGIAYGDGRFIVVGGLPADHPQNYAFEYDLSFRFKQRHILPSGQTRLGIQTAAYFDNHWWFGCYGAPQNAGLLKTDHRFKLTGRSHANFSYGILRLNEDTVLRGECTNNATRGKAERYPQIPNLTSTSGLQVRMGSYNVLFGIWAEPERIGEMFKPYQLDIIAFNEAPAGDWTSRVGRVLGMPYAYVGKISSANHKDKYKSILSRTPIGNHREFAIQAKGWSPASVVSADTIIHGIPFTILSTHIPGRPYVSENAEGSAAALIADSILPTFGNRNLVLLGDLNSLEGDAPLEQLKHQRLRSAWNDLEINTTRLSSHKHIESGTESGVIDHIYFRLKNAKAIEGGIIYNAFNPPNEQKSMPRYRSDWQQYGKPLSDHRPIWVNLELPWEATKPTTIVALGDSITKGVRKGVTTDQTFCTQLEQQLRKSHPQVNIVNLGIGGERTDQALERLSDVIRMRPDLVTIMYGTNDSYIDQGKQKSRLTVNEYRANLKTLILRLRDAQITPVLMTPPRWAKSAKTNGVGKNPNTTLQEFVRVCRETARQHNVPLIDHFDSWNNATVDLNKWTTDACHPNPTGQRQMADTMLIPISSIIRHGHP